MSFIPTWPHRYALALLCASILASCGSGATDTAVSDPGTVALSLSFSSGLVHQGGRTMATVTLARRGGFTGAVNLTVSGAPAGVTAEIANVQNTGTSTIATLTVRVAASAVPGVYPLVVHGNGSGVAEATATYSLTVIVPIPPPPPLAPAYLLEVVGPPLIMVRESGVSSAVTIQVVRTNFGGNVALTVENLPAGVTADFAPNPAVGSTSVLTVRGGNSAPMGTYTNLLVRGVATGLTDRTAPLSLTVSELGFSLSLSVPAVTVVRGGSASITVNVIRTSFQGPVTVAVEMDEHESQPGITAVIAPNRVTGNSSTLTLTVNGAVPVGVYHFYLWAEGAPQHVWYSDWIVLTVVAAGD